MCRSVTVTQQAVLTYVTQFCGTQTLRIVGTYGRQQETEMRHCLLTPYFVEINMKYWYRKTNYRTPLLSVMPHTTCSSVSVVNTLLQWYLQFFSVSTATWPVFFGVRVSAEYSWHVFTRNSRSVWNLTTIHDTHSVLETTPTTHHHKVHYNTWWYKFI